MVRLGSSEATERGDGPAATWGAVLRFHRYLPPLILALTMAALVVLVPPAGEFATGDDWVYARVVEVLVERGQLELPPWLGASLILQAYWGAAFVKVFGFSHTTLRCSTLVLSALGILSFYQLGSELLGRWRAFAAALLLLTNPLYVVLSYSFMTDVPFLSLALLAMACAVRALRPSAPSLAWLAAGSLVAGGAFLVRQLGVLLPLAALGGVAVSGGRRAALRLQLLAALFGPFLLGVLIWAYFDANRAVREPTSTAVLEFWAATRPNAHLIVLGRLETITATIAFFTLPLTGALLLCRPSLSLVGWQRGLAAAALAWFGLGCFVQSGRVVHGLFVVPLGLAALVPWRRLGLHPRWRRLAVGLLLSLTLGLLTQTSLFGEALRFPQVRGILTEHELNARVLGGLPAGELLAPTAAPLATGASLAGAGVLLLVVVWACRWATRNAATTVPLLFALFGLGTLVAAEVVRDRYLLPLLPGALLAAAAPPRNARLVVTLGLLGAVASAAWSIRWEREYLAREGAIWEVARTLAERGIPADQIDGGYAWNGWHRGQDLMAEITATGDPQSVVPLVERRLFWPGDKWYVDTAVRDEACPGRVLIELEYGGGQRIFGVERC